MESRAEVVNEASRICRSPGAHERGTAGEGTLVSCIERANGKRDVTEIPRNADVSPTTWAVAGVNFCRSDGARSCVRQQSVACSPFRPFKAAVTEIQ